MSQTAPENQPPATPPARPEGISETEWNALGDPGKQAIVRERAARADLETQLAAARARPTPPPGVPVAPTQPAAVAPAVPAAPPAPAAPGAPPDFAAIVQQAVTAAVTPLQQRLDARDVHDAAERVRTAVTTAAGDRFHNANDAFTNIDLNSILDGNGQPDQAKITAALDTVLTQKPYLAKPTDPRRFAAPGVGPTPGPGTAPIEDRVKDVLGEMQRTTGLSFSG